MRRDFFENGMGWDGDFLRVGWDEMGQDFYGSGMGWDEIKNENGMGPSRDHPNENLAKYHWDRPI